MSVYETVYLPGDTSASTIPPAETNSELYDPGSELVYQTSSDPEATAELGGSEKNNNFTVFPEDDDLQYELWDDLRTHTLLSHHSIVMLHRNPFTPDDLLERARDEVAGRGGRLSYENGEPSISQVLTALAVLTTKTSYRPVSISPVRQETFDPESRLAVTSFHAFHPQELAEITGGAEAIK